MEPRSGRVTGLDHLKSPLALRVFSSILLPAEKHFFGYVLIVTPNFHVEPESLKMQLIQAKEKMDSGLYL